MTQTFTFRDAVPGDEPRILGFIRELAALENLLHEVEATEAGLASALFGPRRHAEALLVDVAGQPVGFSLWHYTFSSFVGAPSLFVEDVFVRQAHRRGGIGRAIFADLARRALAAGCKRMDWSVLESNADAIAFYRRIGARPVEGWRTQRLTGAALEQLAA